MNFLQVLIADGKPISYVIVGCLVVGIFLFVYRFLHFHGMSVDTESFLGGVKNNLQDNKIVEAIAICRETHVPVATVCERILSRNSKDEGVLHLAADEAILVEIPKLQSLNRLQNCLSHICPYLGLLGTVTALMKLFQKLDANGAGLSIARMAPDVRMALVTTAMGLVAGVVLYFLNVILEERRHAIVYDMQKAAVELINYIAEPQDLASSINGETKPVRKGTANSK